MTPRLLAVVLILLGSHGLAAGQSLSERQAQARREQEALRARIQTLQKEIESQESSRKDARLALRESEVAISDLSRELARLDDQVGQTRRELTALAGQTREQEAVLAQRREELAGQLRAQYSSGLSPWTALLSGDDPQVIGRELGYLGYVSGYRAAAVRSVAQAIRDLQSLRERSQARQRELEDLVGQARSRQTDLERQKAQRQAVLHKIDAQLQARRSQEEDMQSNEARLGRLVKELDLEIARQAEAARLAAERERAEAQRRAEEARQQAREQQEALERERARLREAEQALEQAREQAQRERLERETAQARLQAEQARAEAEQAEQAARERQQAATTMRGEVPGAGQPGAMTGLVRNLPRPVNGEVLGRFGAERPDGGVWRGIVLRAPEGTHVRAVASGKVVFASWLNGFGNIVIVDHGQQYLSVYAYNQGLLKEVGDPVGAGDVIATVGATGGQVEPGLYFEIRHQGLPVNPQLWLGR